MSKMILTLLIAAGSLLFFQGVQPSSIRSVVRDSVVIKYPKNVKAIVDAKCINCHSPESKNQKAKDKLLWGELPKLDRAKQISKMDDIIEVLEKGSMPPKRTLETKPELKLTNSEVKTMKKWAEATADKLLK